MGERTVALEMKMDERVGRRCIKMILQVAIFVFSIFKLSFFKSF